MKKLLNKKEEKDLKSHGYSLKLKTDPSGLIVKGIIVISNGNKELHDSGYPYIKILGILENKKLVFLGWHDHYLSHISTNTDSLGKNIFHVFPWASIKKWKVRENFSSYSTFEIGDYNHENKEFIILQ